MENTFQKNIEKIFTVFSNRSRLTSLKKGGVIFTDERCILIHHGAVALCRQHDDLIMGYFHGPMIFGLNLKRTETGYYLKAFGTVEYESIKHSTALQLAEEHQLWDSISFYLMEILSRALNNHYNMTGMSTKDVIIACLVKLNDEDDIIRLQINAADYVLSKTHLSRSSVMKTFARMRDQKALTLNKGVLISLNTEKLNAS